MKIFRNNEVFELTFTEIIQAHEEYEFECAVEDVKSMLKSGARDVKLSEEQINEVASLALRNLTKSDSYYESYWMSVEYTLDDYINNLTINEEENN